VLEGKIAVVTGAGRGVGQRAALRLAARGADVALIARSEGQLRETADAIAGIGRRAAVIPIDLAREPVPDRIRDAVEAGLGRPSILVNAAGTFGPLAHIRDSDPAEWIATMTVNMVSHYVTCRAFVGGMIEQGWGRIINVSSAAALLEPGPIDSAYATSKAALNHFTRHLAAELAGTGVTANVIHPGDVKTDMWADIRARADSLGDAAAGYRQWVEWVGATGGDDPEKAADLIARLAGDESAAINGQFLWIEGGLREPTPSW
jgi:NAD(P)-dependent dehydrogenase (short-subunit alcohol dehydrogenase family)